jgi:hypothetical protein
MEINKLGEQIQGVVPTADVVEGKFGLLTTHVWSYDWGSLTDLPGWKVPATAEEANRARWIITWPVDERPTPIYASVPSRTWGTRGGFGQAVQTPFAATVYLTHQGNQESLTIPSGYPSLAFLEGIFTVPTVCYIANVNLHNVGANVIVANTAEDGADAGKLKYQAALDARVVGTVRYYDSTTGKLTVITKD